VESLICGRFRLSLARPLVMGIVNLTRDSFSGDGLADSGDPVLVALERARRMLASGADILDIGAESTRPGAEPVSLGEELGRIVPVVRALHPLGVPLSVDTSKPEVMVAAIKAGADMVNDVNALLAPGAIEAVAGSTVALCLMHRRGEPRTMQQNPIYDDVVAEVADFLADRIRALEQAGIARNRLTVDPGFGFGKTVAHNYELLARLKEFASLGVPVLAGLSRKSMLGAVTGKPVADRLAASVAAAVLAAERGAAILRVHDVAATVDGLKILNSVRSKR
jgi:dihydropteroate synthase